MRIDQLATVLAYIDTSIQDTDLLLYYEELLAALAAVADGAAADVQTARERLLALQQELEPAQWDSDKMAIWRTYGAQGRLGVAAAERINRTFVENFMQPEQVAEKIELLRLETEQLGERVADLLVGLDPLLTAAPSVDIDVIKGEIMPMVRAPQHGGVLQSLRSRLPIGRSGNAIVKADELSLSAKVLAAAPVVLAAAGKALELYLNYQEKKQPPAQTTKQQPAEKPATTPAVYYPTAADRTVVTSYSTYSYRRSVYVVRKDRTDR